jgi:hypothetical protein
MRFGIVNSYDLMLSIPGESGWLVHGFTITTRTLSFFRIMHSAFATPARYVQEIFLRLCVLEGDGPRVAKFVFNPLYDIGQLGVALVLSAIKDATPFDGITIFTDGNGLPAGYLFPPSLRVDEAHFLTLLSTVDGEVDMVLCRLLFQNESRCQSVPHLDLAKTGHNGFLYEPNLETFRWLSWQAVTMLKMPGRRKLRDISFTAIMPCHAGDVLFFALAFNRSATHISRFAVGHAYQAIVEDNAPALAVVPIGTPSVSHAEKFRQGRFFSSEASFDGTKKYLPQDGFYYYCHHSRDSNAAAFHLIDQFAFALGEQCYLEQELLSRCKLSTPGLFQPELPTNEAIHVLLHFDGGWPLKIYPKPQQDRLIDLLHAKGYKVTVLAGDHYGNAKCTATTFKSYAQFKALLQTQHLIVGMDSFPAHYAAHVLGLPTLCLFASTRPENADAPVAQNYLPLEQGLRCRPCNGFAHCPLYGGTACRNFVHPETVANSIESMLLAVNQKGVGESVPPTPSHGGVNRLHLTPKPDAVSVRNLSLRFLRLRILLLTMTEFMVPRLPRILRLCEAFFASLSRDGVVVTYLRTLRQVRKIFSRS